MWDFYFNAIPETNYATLAAQMTATMVNSITKDIGTGRVIMRDKQWDTITIQFTANQIAVTDSGNYFAWNDVEAILQEIWNSLASISWWIPTTEAIQDIVWTFLANTETIIWTYDDTNNNLKWNIIFIDSSQITFDKWTIITGTRYPDYWNTALTNIQRWHYMKTINWKTQIEFKKATFYLNKPSTVWPLTIELFVNNTSIWTITVAVNTNLWTFTAFTTNWYNDWSLLSYQFTAVPETDLVWQLIIESKDI